MKTNRPIKPETLLLTIIRPALLLLNLPTRTQAQAEVQLMATAYQESNCCTRVQIHGTARGLWQIELYTARVVIRKYLTAARAIGDLALFAVDPPETFDVLIPDALLHNLLEYNDMVGCIIARGILAMDPAPLPQLDEPEQAWICYIRNWKPGKPRLDDWAENYKLAIETHKSFTHTSAE